MPCLARLLHSQMDFSLRLNHKQKSSGFPHQRGTQFTRIAESRERFATAGDPLFSEISKNWAGSPLDRRETMLKHIRNTTTSTALRDRAQLVRSKYSNGVKIPDSETLPLPLGKHEALPNCPTGTTRFTPAETGELFLRGPQAAPSIQFGSS